MQLLRLLNSRGVIFICGTICSHLPWKGKLKSGTYACTCENCGHFFKFRAVEDLKASITLQINGQLYDGKAFVFSFSIYIRVLSGQNMITCLFVWVGGGGERERGEREIGSEGIARARAHTHKEREKKRGGGMTTRKSARNPGFKLCKLSY